MGWASNCLCCTVLPLLPQERLKHLSQCGLFIRSWFDPLLGKDYNDPTKSKHGKLPPLSRVDVQHMATDVHEITVLPFMQLQIWMDCKTALCLWQKLCRSTATTCSQPQSAVTRITNHWSQQARTPQSGDCSALVRHEGKIRAPSICNRYRELEKKLATAEVYGDPVFINSLPQLIGDDATTS